MRAFVDVADSPAGTLFFTLNESGAFVLLRFEEGEYETDMEEALELSGFAVSHRPEKTRRARTELLEYTAGKRRRFDSPLARRHSKWRMAVWRALTDVPFGETRTYSEVAAMAGRGASSARAVGSANAASELPLAVPCHRVVGSDGSLTGFAGGLHIKEKLLEHEEKFAGKPPAGYV